jgi:hypothetical protein
LKRDYLHHKLWDSILSIIWIIVFTSYFITFVYYGGTPATDDDVSVSYEFYEKGHFYLFNKGNFIEVSEATYALVGYIEKSFILFIVLFLFVFIATQVYKLNMKRNTLQNEYQ